MSQYANKKYVCGDIYFLIQVFIENAQGVELVLALFHTL